VDDHCKPVGIIEVNETAGELSLVRNNHPHAATILATADTEAAVLEHEELAALLRRRPDIGVVFYGNLAAQLGSKLLRADQALLAEKGQSE
jgi:CRP-like cAMP-binding protein